MAPAAALAQGGPLEIDRTVNRAGVGAIGGIQLPDRQPARSSYPRETGSPLGGLTLARVVGQLACAIPITPGGLGMVETTMTEPMVAQGMTAGQAAAVVLAW